MAVWPTVRSLFAEGTCDEVIVDRAPCAAGFGYDSVFVPSGGDGRTFAEMGREEKQAISHRGKAFGVVRVLLLGAELCGNGWTSRRAITTWSSSGPGPELDP